MDNLYLVHRGRALRCQPWGHVIRTEGPRAVSFGWNSDGLVVEPLDGSVLALAPDHAGALALARAYDSHQIWPRDVTWQGFAVSAITAPGDDDDVSPSRVCIVVLASICAGLILAGAGVAFIIWTGGAP